MIEGTPDTRRACFNAAGIDSPSRSSRLAAGEIVKHFRHDFFVRAGAALFIAALAAPGFAQGADYKIGFVNGERLFREAAPGQARATEDRKGIRRPRCRDPEKAPKQVRDLQALLEKDGVTMAEGRPACQGTRPRQHLARDLQRMQREFREDLNLRKQ